MKKKTRTKEQYIQYDKVGRREMHILTVNTVGAHMRCRDAQLICRGVQDMGNSTTLGCFAGTRAGRCHMMKQQHRVEQLKTCVQIMRTMRWKHGGLMW